MKKITLLCFAFFAMTFTFQVNAQCTTGGAYQGSALVNDGSVEQQSACNYFGEYSNTTNVIDGNDYMFSTDSGYVTVTTSDGATVIGHGASPLTLTGVTTSGDGAIRVYWHLDAACGTDSSCHVTTVQCVSASCVPPPPAANDECTGAIAVNCGDTAITGDTSANNVTDTGGNTAADLWYSYTVSGAVDQDVTIDMCASSYDTAFRVYDDCPATNQILFNDDSGECAVGTRSKGTFTAVVGTTYYIMIEGYNTSEGVFSFDVTCEDNAIPAPGNDLCANATGLTIGTTLSGETTAGATDSSTGPDDDTTCQGFSFKSDVWYTFTTTGTNDVTITTTLTGSSTEASIAVYPNCGQLDAESVGCSVTSPLDIAALPEGTYYVRVWSDGEAARVEGTFDIVADATLSAQDNNANGLAFKYYPNPVNDNLSLKAQKDIENVSVYNMLGQEVLNTVPNAVNTEVNMSALQSGAYFVKVTIGNVTETVKVLKN